MMGEVPVSLAIASGGVRVLMDKNVVKLTLYDALLAA